MAEIVYPAPCSLVSHHTAIQVNFEEMKKKKTKKPNILKKHHAQRQQPQQRHDVTGGRNDVPDMRTCSPPSEGRVGVVPSVAVRANDFKFSPRK